MKNEENTVQSTDIIDEIIKNAKLGRERRDAQTETCSVFAAALYDVLSSHGISCKMFTAQKEKEWAHSIVKVGNRFYDSMGEFSTEIYRKRAKIHPTVKFEISYKSDLRKDCYEQEYDELHAFFVKMLNKSTIALNKKTEQKETHEEDPAENPCP